MGAVELRSRRLRVLHVVHSGRLGGGPRMVEMLATAEDGNVHAVVSSSDGGLLDEVAGAGVAVFEVAMHRKHALPWAVVRLRRVVRAWSPDVVVCRGQFAGVIGAVATRRIPAIPLAYVAAFPSFYARRGPIRDVRNRLVELATCRVASSVIVLNEADRKVFIGQRLASPSVLRRIPNGVSTELFHPDGRRPHHRIGFVGRMVGDKGVDVLLDALPFLPPALRRSLEVVLIGDGPDLPALSERARSVRARCTGEVPSITFLGARTATPDFYRDCALLAVPSRREPFGIVALEALACGVPVVASRVGGLAETIQDRATGLLVEPESPPSLAAAMALILSDRAFRDRLAIAASEDVLRRFTIERMRRAYRQMYADVDAARPVAHRHRTGRK